MLLPTPTASTYGSNSGGERPGRRRPSLATMARRAEWPTPTVRGNYNRRGSSTNAGDGLETAVRFRTPNATDGAKWSLQTQAQREAKGQQVRLCHQLEAGGLLNPTWVEWLMGWPLGWTDLSGSGLARFHEWQRSHSESSPAAQG